MMSAKWLYTKGSWALLGIFCSTLIVACDRRPLEEELPIVAKIPVKIYWDLAEIAPKNATILFYSADGSLYKEWQTASQPTYAEGEVELAPGSYTAVVFNELMNQIDYVRMSGSERLETFEAYITANLSPAYKFSFRDENGVQVNQPGILAACIATINVTPDMVTRSQAEVRASAFDALIDLHPDRKTAQANMLVHVRGLNNARMPAVAELRHMASSYFFATDRNSLVPVTAQFRMNNRTYDPGSKTDGTISAIITTFGVLGEWHHIGDTPDAAFYLDIAFMLTDAQQTIVEASTNITDLMEIIVDEKIMVTINIELNAPPLPEIKPVGGSDSGFSTELVDWDKIIVPLGR